MREAALGRTGEPLEALKFTACTGWRASTCPRQLLARSRALPLPIVSPVEKWQPKWFIIPRQLFRPFNHRPRGFNKRKRESTSNNEGDSTKRADHIQHREKTTARAPLYQLLVLPTRVRLLALT